MTDFVSSPRINFFQPIRFIFRSMMEMSQTSWCSRRCPSSTSASASGTRTSSSHPTWPAPAIQTWVLRLLGRSKIPAGLIFKPRPPSYSIIFYIEGLGWFYYCSPHYGTARSDNLIGSGSVLPPNAQESLSFDSSFITALLGPRELNPGRLLNQSSTLSVTSLLLRPTGHF